MQLLTALLIFILVIGSISLIATYWWQLAVVIGLAIVLRIVWSRTQL